MGHVDKKADSDYVTHMFKYPAQINEIYDNFIKVCKSLYSLTLIK